ncbi:AcrR family transcriptional regulator [Nonomuraea thailandensis]|uniref:AcrR family transcriptional regulator n=1 Tax=Nonomuraea thailandensis TaxID=1188745 RepID=A0A9X2GJ44_9ACTN|nr:TetR/AcrR family transcriptional regulator [Nonomuraea thailandensis]MCP2358504.1 AcrR family transcriptional regulator [Nonomuraea thailandensis]
MDRERSLDDLTARARIRDAALAQFAEHGVRAARLQDIARAAGVSVGLVQHHYGTKDGLRDACDSHVLEQLVQRVKDEAARPDPGGLAALYEGGELMVRYLARALADGSPAAEVFFAGAVRVTEEFLTSTWPDRFPAGSAKARDAAAVMSAMHAGAIVLHPYLSRRMGVDVLAREHATVIGAAMTEVYDAMGEFARSEAGRHLTEEHGDD